MRTLIILVTLLLAAPPVLAGSTRGIFGPDAGHQAVQLASSGHGSHDGWRQSGKSWRYRHRGEHRWEHRHHRHFRHFGHDRHWSRHHFRHGSWYRHRSDHPFGLFGTTICLRDGWTRICFIDRGWPGIWHD